MGVGLQYLGEEIGMLRDEGLHHRQQVRSVGHAVPRNKNAGVAVYWQSITKRTTRKGAGAGVVPFEQVEVVGSEDIRRQANRQVLGRHLRRTGQNDG